MASDRISRDPVVERGSLPLDIDDVHVLLQVEQEQIQKRTFTNWVNAQLSKRKPPAAVQDLFHDFRDGSRLLDLLEVMCSQRMNREKIKGVFQHRANIEKSLSFLRAKSIKLVNINVPDIMDGKPSIILGLIWTIIMHFHIEEFASTLSFSSRQSSLESLASLDTRSTSSSARSSPVPPHGTPLHTRFRISAKKALLLWVREQCHKAGCTLNVKDFKASWRSGVVFLAVLCALRPDVANLSAAKTRSNRQNLEEAFRLAERELHIPRLLDPADVDVREPDEKSIMTYVAQFLQYSKDTPSSEEDMQVQYLTPATCVSPVNLPCNFTPAVAASPLRQTSASQKAQEVACWLEQAYQELLEGWESTEGESYSERYHVFQTFVVSFNEQRRPVMPLLTAMKRTARLSEEQRALRHAWDSLAEKLREYKAELDLTLPTPLDTVGRWLLRAEEALADGGSDRQDHVRAAQEAREKHQLFKSCLEEMPQHTKTFQIFQNMDEYGEVVVPTDKLDEIKRRFTSVRVSAKYHGIRLDYQEHRHTVLDLLDQFSVKLRTWKRGYISREAVRILMKDWNETVNKQGLPSVLEGTLFKLTHIANKYTSKSALAGDSNHVSSQMKDMESRTTAVLEEVKTVKGTLARILAAWESYCDTYSSLHAWLEQGTQTNRHGQRADVTIEMMSEWSSRKERLNEVGNYLMDVTDSQTSHSLSDDLCRINLMWADFVRRTQFELVEEQTVAPPNPQSLQGLIKEATQLLKEPVEVISISLQTFKKRLQFVMKKIQDIDVDSLALSFECSTEMVKKLKQATPEVLQTLCEATQVCEELQRSVSSLDGRLAELIHWESDAREFYGLLKEKSQRHQREQDSRTRALISRGLQLEGQVVMEEQDLQEMVMSRQKNSPLQYLIASNMQDRARATVAQSQEVVGMLSSLGARRERSPTGRQPPQNLFVQEQEVSKGEIQPKPVPMIVVQEYQEERNQIPSAAVPRIRKASSSQSKSEPQVPPEDKPRGNLAGAVALGKPMRQERKDTKETTETLSHHLDTTLTPDKSQELPTTQQPLTVPQEPTQSQMQMDTQTQVQQQTVHIQKQITSQQQTLFQSEKVKKCKKHAVNRPWLHNKAQTEVLVSEQVLPQSMDISTVVSQPSESASDSVQAQNNMAWVQQQQSITVTTGTASHVQASETDRIKTQANNITQTQALQIQQQQPSTIISTAAFDSVSTTHPIQSEPKNLIQTQFQVAHAQKQQSVKQVTKVDQVQKQQPVTPIKLGCVDPQPQVSQMLAKEQVPPVVISQKQPLSVQQHLHPFTSTTCTQPATKPSEMQPHFITQIQRPFLPQTQPPIISHTYQHLPDQREESHTLRHYPSTPVQPPAITQPHPGAAQSLFQSLPEQTISPTQSQIIPISATQPKGKAPIQPRIITMPQNQPQFYNPPQSQTLVMGMEQTHDNVQLRSQPHIQQSQWRPVTPDLMAQNYPQPPHQGIMQSHVPPQAQLQTHDVTATQSQQWTPLRGGVFTQTYPSIQGSGHVPYPQSQGYPSSQQPSQQWGQFGCEPPVQCYSQTSPQSQLQSFVSSQHWQPIRQSGMASHSYPRVQGPEYPQVQHQVTSRPPSLLQEWSNLAEPHPQIQVLKMAPQQMAHTPWVQPPSKVPATIPAPQQPHTQQQHWPQFRPEAPFPVQIQNQTLSQPQPQVLQKPQSQQNQKQSVSQVKPPTLVPTRPQEPAQLQAQTQTLKSTQYTLEDHLQIQSHTSQTQTQLKVLNEPRTPVQEQRQQHSGAQAKPPAQDQGPPQVYSEAYTKAQVLAKSKFENAKRCLQQHVLVTINIFKDKKKINQESLDVKFLNDLLGSVQVMEAFCTPSELQDMEIFTRSVRTQWETCFSAETNVVSAEQQMEALKQLCETLSPGDGSREVQDKLRERETTLTAIPPPSSVDLDVIQTLSGVFIEQKKEAQKTSVPEKPVELLTDTLPVTSQRPKTVEKKEILKQISTEEDRYRSSRFALQAQLNRNEQNMLGDRPSGSATAADLQKWLRELKALQDETESLWSEYETQCSQCSQINERAVEQDRAEITIKWREQRSQLQRRVDSLASALELMDSIEHHIAEISERLEKFFKEAKDVKGNTLINTNLLKDVKDLDESIQTQMDRLARFDSEPSHLDLRDRSPLTQLVLKHRSSLDRLRHQVRKSEAAARALDRFLVSLHTLDQDVLFVQSVPCADATVLQDSRSKLALIRKGAASLGDKAPQLDQLLGGAQMRVTREGSSVTCLDMVVVLVRKLEDADDKLIVRQEELLTAQQIHGIGLRKKTLLVELRKVQALVEKQGLKEPTIPAVQHRLRALSDLEMQMNSLRPEYESIREIPANTEQRDELQTVWEETQKVIAERQEHCSTIITLLKKFQSCRSFLRNILQSAEQTISEQTSYISKDNLQRLIARVGGIKEDLSGVGSKIEEFRVLCRQLQSQLKKLPECSETPFESEADALVDSWLDLSEKTDSYSDGLCMGLEVWEKQLMLGEEMEVWASIKLVLFAESHPFSSEKEVFQMKDEIQTQEQSIEQFHRKSLEVQELLQGKEAPLELQVMETALKKKLEQVKELFDSCTEVFRELLSVRAHLLQRIDVCHAAVQQIHASVRNLRVDSKDLLHKHLQELSEQLLDQEEELESLMKEVELMSSVTAPEALEEPANKIKHLKDNITVTREFLIHKKEQGEKSILVQSIKDECQMFEDWLQDAQLAVNECFENPETREDVDASMQRLQEFLSSEEGEQRLVQVKKALEKEGQEEVPAETQAELCAWQQEQEGELTTLRAHCQGRHKQLQDILIKLNSLQTEHDYFEEWLRQKETLSVREREELRQVQEIFLKESGRIEALSDLLASVRLKGLRGDPVLRDSEALVDQYHSLGIRLENQSQIYKSLETEMEIFHVKEEKTKTWLKQLKESLESIDKDNLTEENLLNIQAVLDLRAEGESETAALAKDGENLCSHEEMEESVRQDLLWTLRNIHDGWRRVQDLAQQLKAQSDFQQNLLKELEALQEEEKDVRSWLEELMRKLEDSPTHERYDMLQEVLSLKPEGDSKLLTLRRNGARIFTRDEKKKRRIEQSHRELEDQWLRVLQTVQEMKNQTEREDDLAKELQSFQDQIERTQAWIGKLKVILQSVDKAEEIMTQTQIILIHGPEGDSKLAALQHTGELLCRREGLKHDNMTSIQQTHRALAQDWRELLDLAQTLRKEAEIQAALDKELQDFNSQEESFQTWLKDLQERLESLDSDVPPPEILLLSQDILSLQPEADLKMAALKACGENLCKKLHESRREFVQQNLKDVQEKLRMLMENAQQYRTQAEVQDSLSRELQTFHAELKTLKSWVEDLQQDLVSVGKSTHGTQEQIEERLNKTHEVLARRAEGNAKVSSLKRKRESLCARDDLQQQSRRSVVQDLKTLEEDWKGVLQNAQELYSLLRNLVERLVSCQCQRQQTRSRVEQLKEQTAALPRHFSWPGLGERRHAVEGATALLDKARSLNPTVSALRALSREMSQLTRDPSWTDPSWSAVEELIPVLIKDLMEVREDLEEGIRTERKCVQLVEQHSAAQDWLREQVKGFGAPPSDRHGLQESINTLKALLQTVEREEREMKELHRAKDALLHLCTAGGRHALILETGHLHDLCAASEKEIKERLDLCETRLFGIESKITERAEDLRVQAESILNDLRAQECRGFIQGYKNLHQLQENWNILKTCEKEQEAIEERVCALSQAMRATQPDEDLPSNVVSLIDTVTQQYCRLQSRLSDRQNECADSTVQCMRDTLQALRSWTQSTQPVIDSAYTIQEMIEQGAMLHKNLQEALSHKQLLADCLGYELTDKLERDGSNALKDAEALIIQLRQKLQNLEEEMMKTKSHSSSLETQTSHLFSEVSREWSTTLNTITEVGVDSSDSVVRPFLIETRGRDDASDIEETYVKTERHLTASPDHKPPVSKVLVNEDLLSEPRPRSADQHGTENRNEEMKNVTLILSVKPDEPSDVNKSESLKTDPQTIHTDIQDHLEFKPKRMKTSEDLEEKEVPLNTAICTVISVTHSREETEFIGDSSLTARRDDQSKLDTDGLCNAAPASDAAAEDDECDFGLVKDEGTFEMEMKGRENIKSAFCGELHEAETSVEVNSEESVESLGIEMFARFHQECAAVEEAPQIPSDSSENEKAEKKKIATLILDTDAVHLHTTEVPAVITANAGGLDVCAESGIDDAFDQTRKEFDRLISLHHHELENSGNVGESTKSSQLSDENVDLQTETLSGQRTESPELNIAHAEREGTWTTTNSPPDVQRAMDLFEEWTANNGPRETQRRYVILERPEGEEIRRDPAAEASMPGLNAATSKPRKVVPDVSTLELAENVTQGDDETVELYSQNESKTTPIIETSLFAPARWKAQKISVNPENVDEAIVDVERKQNTMKEPETQLTRQFEDIKRLTDVHSEEENTPVSDIQQYVSDETHAEVLPTPPNRRHKEKSVVSQTLRVEEVTPTAPTSQRDSRTEAGTDSRDLDKTRTKQLAVEESSEKPTPPVRHKPSLDESSFISPPLSKPKSVKDLEATHLKQRKDSGSGRDTEGKEINSQIAENTGFEGTGFESTGFEGTGFEGTGFENTGFEGTVFESTGFEGTGFESTGFEGTTEEFLVKPTPPVRRKGSRASQILEMEETWMKPTPPTRRRDSKNFSDRSYVEMASKMSSSTDLGKIMSQEKDLEETLIKPTPPVRRKTSIQPEHDSVSVLSKIHEVVENIVKPTPPVRRRESRNMSDVISSKRSSCTDLEKTVAQEKDHAEPPPTPSPTVRRKTSRFESTFKTQELEGAVLKPTPPSRRRNSGNVTDTRPSRFSACSLENLSVEETFFNPTQPLRRKTSRAESDDFVFSDNTWETLVKPTPPTRRRDGRNASDSGAIQTSSSTDLENLLSKEKCLSELRMKPTPPARRKTLPAGRDYSSVSQTQGSEEALVKPTPPTRRRENRNMIDVMSKASSISNLEKVPEETHIKPTDGIESDVHSVLFKQQEKDEKPEEPTPPARRRERENMNDCMAYIISVSSDVRRQARDAEDALVKPVPPEDTPMKPTPPARRRESRNTAEIIPKERESYTDLDRTNEKLNTDLLDKSVRHEINQAESDTFFVDKLHETVEPVEPVEPVATSLTCWRENRNMDQPKQTEDEFLNISDLNKNVSSVGSKASQAESGISILDETQVIEEALEKPRPPAHRNVDEKESEIPNLTDLDETVTRECADPKRAESGIYPAVSQELEETKTRDTNLNEIVAKKQETEIYNITDLNKTVRKERSDMEDLVNPADRVANQCTFSTSPEKDEQMLEQYTTLTRTESDLKSDEVSQSKVQEGLIKPTPGENDDKIQHESTKASCVSTEPEESTTTIITHINTTSLIAEPIQPSALFSDEEKTHEAQTVNKQDDEDPEGKFCSALRLESSEDVTERESLTLFETKVQNEDKSETLTEDVSAVRGVVPEVLEAKEEEEEEKEEEEEEEEEKEEEEPLGATMNIIFAEIEKMSKTRPNSLLIENRSYDDPLCVLNTSDVDLESQLHRLLLCIQSCRNNPAVLNPTDMAKQVEEAELCRQSAQKQVSSISKQDHVNGDVSSLAAASACDPDTIRRLSCQWTEALWDVSGTVDAKEAQLQLVIDYDRQMQKAKATLEKLAGELEALKMCPVESSFVEEQRLRSFLRTMEQERTLLGDLIQTYGKLSLHLSQPERAASQLQQNILQSEWKTLERLAEKTLHNVNTCSKESFDLLEDVHTLKDHVENFHTVMGTPWMMEIGAELEAAKHRYYDLHQSFEALSRGCTLKVEVFNIQQVLWSIKDHMDLIGEELASSFPTSNNPNVVRIMAAITESLAWAKKTEYDIQRRQRKISLLPEEVHRQINDWKKLHSEMISKQSEVTKLSEDVTQLSPDVDKQDVSLLTSFLTRLESLSKSALGKLNTAMEEIQLSLQTREKISEQMAHVESWILCHLHKESLSREDLQSLSWPDLDRRLRQSQDAICEAENHAGVTEALLMTSKDIASELSISENASLYEKLTELQEDVKGVVDYEKCFILEITDILQKQESSEQKMASLERKLMQITIDMKEHTFPITKETLSSIQPFKSVLMEHKLQAEQINTSAEGKRRELLSLISELHHKLKAFHIKAQIHERFLNLKQRVEDLRENLQICVPKTNDESVSEEERYKICQNLLTQIPLIKLLYKEAFEELTNISSDLYPSQITSEQETLKQNLQNLNALEQTLQKNLHNVEWKILKEIRFVSEQKVLHVFLAELQQVLETTYEVEPSQDVVEDELGKFLKLKMNVEARCRVLEVLEMKNGLQEESPNTKVTAELTKRLLDKCEKRLEDLHKAKQSLKTFSTRVRNVKHFLLRTESLLLPSLCSARSCSERLKDVQQALITSHNEFHSHLLEIQTHAFFTPLFCVQKVERLRIDVLARLLVRMSALKAQAQLRLQALERCVNKQRNIRVCYEDMCRRIRDSETTLAECASKNITSQTECRAQQEKLNTLVNEIDALPAKLDQLTEWCPVQGCHSNRDAAVKSLWTHVSRLRHCARHLLAHSERRGEEWTRIGKSMEKASSILEQMETELPESVIEKASAEELQDLLRFWFPYQDRLDCEHRALSALELRVARLLRVPSHLEQAPPIPLCQELRTMQERYHSLKSRSAQGCKAVQTEIKERKQVCEELQGIRDWITTAGFVLLELDQIPNSERLQVLHSELCTQKAVLQRIMEGLRMKYSDMYTLVPVEIDIPLQEDSDLLQDVVKKVEAAVQKSGPLHRLDAKLSEIKTGLDAAQNRLQKKCANVEEAEKTQKRAQDELDGLRSRLVAVETELRDLSEEKTEELQDTKEKISQTHKLHTQLSTQAEERTAFNNKIRAWLREQDEMVKGSQSWITESQCWLNWAYVFTSAECLDSRVNSLQMVLDDSAQIRRTLQGFESVLKEMASVCDVTELQRELLEADGRVADVQNNLLEHLKTLEHAAAEVDAMESEVRIMENDVTDLRSALTSKQGISQEKFRAAVNRMELMKRTVDEMKSCKTGLRLPEGTGCSLTVFTRAELLLNKLLELEQLALEHTVVTSEPCETSCSTLRVPPTIIEEEPQDSVLEQGQVEIVRMTDDVLTRSGAVLMSVKEATLQQPNESSAQTEDIESGETAAAAAEGEGKESDVKAEGREFVVPPVSSDPDVFSDAEVSVRTQSPPAEPVTKPEFITEPSTSPPGGLQKCVIS